MCQTIDIEEIYRLVSKNLNFMAYGSVLNRFCAFFDRLSMDGADWRRVGGGLRRIEEGWRRTGGGQIGGKSRRTMSYVFCIFTPLYHRFRFSRVFQTIDIEEIYRLVATNIHFMPYGSLLNRFSIDV